MAEPGAATMDSGEAARLVPTRFAGPQAAPAPLSAVPPGPYGRHLTDAGDDEIVAAMRQVWPGRRDSERARARGARLLLEHLSAFPGEGWQQRWEASGLDEANQPVNVMIPGQEGRKEICTGAACLFSLRVIRPSLLALRSTRFAGYGGRFLEAQRDPLLEEFRKRVRDQPVHPMHHTAALFDVAVALTTQSIALAGLTPEAFLHYIWQSRDQGLTMKARGRQNRGQFPGQLAWPVLHEMGVFPSSSPATVRAAVLTGRRTLEELVDRYDIRHQRVRQLILDYLARRRTELDYSSLDQHARSLAGAFWAKIEALSPGHPDLRIDADLYHRWREALNTRQDGQGKRHEVERILRSVRSFYTDLHSWAVEEPEKWAPWVAPCPIPDNALRGLTAHKRRTKERIDDRIRRRQPLLPALVAHLEDRYHHLRELLRHAAPLGLRRVLRPRRPLLPADLDQPATNGGGATADKPASGSATWPTARTSTSPSPRSWPSGNGRPRKSCATAAAGSRSSSSSPTSASASTSGLTARSSRCWSSPRPRPTASVSSRCRPSSSRSSPPLSAATPQAAGPYRSSSATTSTSAG